MEDHGHGLTEDHPNVVKLRASLDLITQAEKMSVSNLERAMRDHPLGPWIKAQNGLGLKTTARLLSAIGDPYANELHNWPRTVSELWAYCGLAVQRPCPETDQGPGEQLERHRAKMRVWNMVQLIIKNRNSPTDTCTTRPRPLWRDRSTTNGMAGKMFKSQPIVVGQLLSAGRIHNRAQRRVAKAILKDLWVEAKRIHEERARDPGVRPEDRAKPNA